MRQKHGLCLAMALALALFCGCAEVEWVKIQYLTPGSSGVALKKNCKVKLIASGEQQLAKATLDAIVADLNAHPEGGVQVVFGENDEVDYYMLLNVSSAFRVSSKESVQFNTNKRIAHKNPVWDEETNPTSGYDYIQTTPGTPSASGGFNVSLAIYSVAGLDPIHYFVLPMWDGDFNAQNGTVRGNEAFVNEFVKQAGKAFSDMFVTQAKEIDTAIPDNVDVNMKNALLTKDLAKLNELVKAIVNEPFDEFISKVSALKKSERKPYEPSLRALYLLGISKELDNFDSKTLRTLHKEYSQILLVTSEDILAEACANALARIEKKAQMTNTKL